MWHQHKIDPYFGALFITLIGAGVTFFILHTINSIPPQDLEQQQITALNL